MLRRASFAWLTLALLCVAVLAAPEKPGGKAYAFLLACGKFKSGQLRESPHVARDLRQFQDVLEANGYAAADIVLVSDDSSDPQHLPERAKILRALDALLARIGPEDTLLLAYQGQAVKFRGDARGYWCPADARLEDRNTLIPTSGAGGILERLQRCKARRKLLLVDASRKEPASDALLATKTLELEDRDEDEIPAGITAIYSCKPGQRSHAFAVAEPETDWREGSLFFQNLLDAWEGAEPSEENTLKFADLCYLLQWKTAGASRRVFREPQTPVVRRENKGDAGWVLSPKRDALLNGAKIETFEYELDGKKHQGQRELVTAELGDGVTMEFVRIPKGTFLMGPRPGDWSHWKEDRPRRVSITKDFFLGIYEVTQEQYLQVMSNNPSAFSRSGTNSKEVRGLDTRRFPVEQVSWEEATGFCSRLRASGKRRFGGFRLPTEAEWEYACRGGSDKAYCFGDEFEKLDEHAWHRENSGGRTHQVGRRKPNGFGLYDMHGNVQEWCLDWGGLLNTLGLIDPVRFKPPVHSQVRILRGGSWTMPPIDSRAGSRNWGIPKGQAFAEDLGFRVAFSLK
jgi:formylglycine-generating enzyme required for sulfatase activity